MITSAKRSAFGLLTAGTFLVAGAAPAWAQNAPNTKPEQPAQSQPGQKTDAQDAKKQAAKPKIHAAGVKVGEAAPEITLKDTDGKAFKLADFKGKIVVIEWFNPECPVSKRHHTSQQTMTDTATQFKDKGVVWVAVNSGGAGKEGSGLEVNQKAKKDWKIDYAILLDEKGEVGKAYGAKTTPHMFVLDKDGKVAYMGAIDDDSRGDKGTKINYVADALKSLLAGETVKTAETKPYGCNVKY